MDEVRDQYQAYLQGHDTTAPTVEVDGETYRWKMASPREFLTPGGPMVLSRNLYQADSGGKCHIPSAAAIHAMTQEMGQWLETHPGLPEEIRAEEACPAGTRALVASLDRVNVLLAEPGPKRGRPAERPQGSAEEDKVAPTCYKNAMVGSISWYGEVPDGEVCPERLASRYVAHMPEDGAGTLKAESERELVDAEAKLEAGVRKVLPCDGVFCTS